ncbi:hypothetical protein CDL12_11847 [Handroanthus impetiginosus]|uniref:Dof zinc finger protein n=1 Tax=Handroanthus impetiginosus TaxID=429701 RepID=A0A2G9HDC8_9LAMI|nr:hypothetical protein CDL12_11846 [Handroanthus impetiginosus]PIN15514.1 hypothetical protein CDL12_11847 [Handroanthus impetiginosus]
MGITSLQVCMDSSDWLQGTISDEMNGMDSSPITTPTNEDMLACSRPLLERRLRPQHEQALKCPRCDSTHTKFCYYNNYSLSQPRYFCKTCRRYWTKGGTLRNIPVGGGCRKNKKVSNSSKKNNAQSSNDNIHNHNPSSSNSSSSLILNNNYSNSPNSTDLQLAFPEQIQFSSYHAAGGLFNPGNAGFLLENNPGAPIDLMGNGEGYFGNMNYAPFGFCDDANGMNYSGAGGSMILESCQRLMLPYDQNHGNNEVDHHDIKPDSKVLSLEWHDHQQACNSDAGKESFGYNFGGLGSWTGLMNGYGSSATNPLV